MVDISVTTPKVVVFPSRTFRKVSTPQDSVSILARLKSLLPARWFNDRAPVITAVLGGIADSLSGSFAFISYAEKQARLATMGEFWLDLFALDYFGLRFGRRNSQADDSFRVSLYKEIFRVRATREGMRVALLDLTGVSPIIFEPANPRDTGAYGSPTIGWSVAGRYGSNEQPAEIYIDVQRPLGQGVPLISGYGSAASGYGASAGRGEYVSLDDVKGPVTDRDIFRTIEATRPVGTIAWTRIEESLPPPDLAPAYVQLLAPDDQALVMPDGGSIYISGPT